MPEWFTLAAPGPGDQVWQRFLDAVADQPAQNDDLPNYDTDRNDDPGLTLGATRFGLVDTEPGTVQVWVVPADEIVGPVSLTAWVAPAPPDDPPVAMVVRAGLFDCDLTGSTCTRLVRDTVIVEPSGPGFVPVEFDLGLDAPFVVDPGRRLELRLVVPGATSPDVWLGYDSVDTPSELHITP